ncbi:hypothetical protein SmJEL517_g01141 [Synchytrium microbalum]|uniref:Cyclin N-terminal domain-containing protein n=1 Tax=Synchytrium microbalum TaxID=1806994 RepID=A0A507CGI9_9FUNG|nr:uncharacterized protein SmJEL517_g01141 [Synchytrium microbalum]TPX36745.1 hypothetical protein SmJEL517_g01141 [Synchytrium microbalum]
MAAMYTRDRCESTFLRKTCANGIPKSMILTVAEHASQVITCADNAVNQSNIPPLAQFISSLVERSRIPTATFMASFGYIARLRKRLPPTARGMFCTCHRIYLASLLLAGKYLSDTPIKNRTWAAYAGIFSLAEVNLMERQLLYLLDYNLQIPIEELEELAVEYLGVERDSEFAEMFDDTITIPISPAASVSSGCSSSASPASSASPMSISMMPRRMDSDCRDSACSISEAEMSEARLEVMKTTMSPFDQQVPGSSCSSSSDMSMAV